MRRRWEHDVSAAWLKARKQVITATDIAKLMPEIRKARKNPDASLPGFFALWAEKSTPEEIDTSSPSSDAARGHVMEPWAVESWNAQRPEQYFHWDDAIVVRNGVGFSPDAMDIAQLLPGPVFSTSNTGGVYGRKNDPVGTPSSIMEIKSYGPAHHMKCVIKDRMKHDELMQVAVAFYVLPRLQTAKLLFFCPGCPVSMHAEEYSRADLEELIDTVEEARKLWLKTQDTCRKLTSDLHAICTEDDVWNAYVKEQEAKSRFLLKG